MSRTRAQQEADLAAVTQAYKLQLVADGNLLEAAKTAYPIGTVVLVTLGRARVRLRVTGHSAWSGGIGEVLGINTETGKGRKFTAWSLSADPVIVEEAP